MSETQEPQVPEDRAPESARQFSHYFDPVARRLMRIQPGWIFAVSLVLFVLIPLSLAASRGTLVTRDVPGLGEVRGALALSNGFMYLFPLLLALLFHYYRQLPQAFEKLARCQVLTLDEADHTTNKGNQSEVLRALAEEGARVFTPWVSRIRVVIPLAAGLVSVALFLYHGTTSERDNWFFVNQTIEPAAWYTAPVLFAVGFYLMLGWIVHHFGTGMVLGRVFGNRAGLKTQLRIPHPDGWMGLEPLARLSRTTVIIVAVVLVCIASWHVDAFLIVKAKGEPYLPQLFASIIEPAGEFSDPIGSIKGRSVGHLLTWLSYLALAPLIVVLPLRRVHQRMAHTKEEHLTELAREITVAVKREESRELAEEYALSAGQRVWPFSIRGVLGSSVVPAVLSLAAQVLLSKLFE